MEYIQAVPTSYIVSSVLTVLTLFLYLMFKLFPKRKIGIFPTLMGYISKICSRIGQELVDFYVWLFGTITAAVDEFFINPTGLKVSGNIAITLWGVLTLGAIIISYNATLEWAIWMGINSKVAWIFPFIIDLVLIASIIQGIFYAKVGEKPLWPTIVLMGYTLASVYANLDHLVGLNSSIWNVSFGTLLAGIVAPIGILACSEALSQTYRKLALREGMHITDQEIKGHLAEKRKEVARLEAKAKTFEDQMKQILANQERIEALDREIDYMEGTLMNLDRALAGKAPNAADRIEKVQTLAAQGLNHKEIGQELNIKEGTVRSYVRSANGKAN